MNIVLATAKPDTGIPLYTGEKRPPTGLGYLQVILEKAGHAVDLMDRYAGDVRPVPKDTEVFGVYCCSWCREDACHLLSQNSDIRTLAGGPDVWTTRPPADLICKGEAESVILDMVEGDDIGIWSSPRLWDRELEQLPRFPYAWFYHPERRERYDWTMPFSEARPVFTLNTSRGCPFRCAFCETPQIWGHKWTSFFSMRILDEIEYVQRLGAAGLYFREDNFTVSKKRVEAICKGMIEKKLIMPWACECRVDTVNYELLQLMKHSGLEGVYVGVESFSDHMLRVYKKGVDPQQIERFFGWCKNLGIKVMASFIVNGPGETAEDARKSKAFVAKWRPWKVNWNPYRENRT